MNTKKKTISLDLRKSGVTLKQYVIGRRDTNIKIGTLDVGRYLVEVSRDMPQ